MCREQHGAKEGRLGKQAAVCHEQHNCPGDRPAMSTAACRATRVHVHVPVFVCRQSQTCATSSGMEQAGS
jgi:hypothetical protein